MLFICSFADSYEHINTIYTIENMNRFKTGCISDDSSK